MRKEIEAAIRSSLIVENEQSVKHAVDKIIDVIKNSYSDATTQEDIDNESYLVHVICWDGVQYDRLATKVEIDENIQAGYVVGDDYDNLTFDFR